MIEQILLATQLAFEKVDANEMKSVMDKAYARIISMQSEISNILLSESANVLSSESDVNALSEQNEVNALPSS